jgi:hypothetical protein
MSTEMVNPVAEYRVKKKMGRVVWDYDGGGGEGIRETIGSAT